MGQFLDLPPDPTGVAPSLNVAQPRPGTFPEEETKAQTQDQQKINQQEQSQAYGALDWLQKSAIARQSINETPEDELGGIKGSSLANWMREARGALPGTFQQVLQAFGGSSPEEVEAAATRHQKINANLEALKLPYATMNLSAGGSGGGGGRSIGFLFRGGGGGSEGGGAGIGAALGDTAMTKATLLSNLDREDKRALTMIDPKNQGKWLPPGTASNRLRMDQPTIDQAIRSGQWGPRPADEQPAARPSGGAPVQPAPAGQPGPMFAGSAQAATPAQGQQGQAPAPMRFNSIDEMQANVPIGGTFIDPSGNVRRRKK